MHKISKVLFIFSNIYIAMLIVGIITFGNLINEQYCKPECHKLESSLCYKIKSRPFGESVKCKEFIGSNVISEALSVSGNFMYASMFALGAFVYEPSIVFKKPMMFIVVSLLWSPILYWLISILMIFKGGFKYA